MKSNYETLHVRQQNEPLEFTKTIRSKDNKILLVISGGYDSTSLAYLLKQEGYENVTLLNIDFNQEAKFYEFQVVSKLAKKLNYNFEILKIDWDMSSIDAYKASAHIGRNGMFVWKALTKAHIENYDVVMMGVYELDQRDCSDEFMYHMEKAFEIGYGKKIPISRPLVHINKVKLGLILKKYNLLDEVLKISYSCYLKDTCNECASCIERNVVVEELKKYDSSNMK